MRSISSQKTLTISERARGNNSKRTKQSRKSAGASITMMASLRALGSTRKMDYNLKIMHPKDNMENSTEKILKTSTE